MAKMKKEVDYHVKVYILEEYFVSAKDKKEALSKVNMDGNPIHVNTLKITAKKRYI